MPSGGTGKIIAYSGTHGTGKTTAVYSKAASLKKQHPQKSVGIITETAPFCPFPINKEATEAAQSWIFHTQIKKELEAIRFYDLVVSDRTCIDPIAYTWARGFMNLSTAMVLMAHQHLDHYHKIFFRTLEANQYWIPDGIRESSDKAFREKVQEKLYRLYNSLPVAEIMQYV